MRDRFIKLLLDELFKRLRHQIEREEIDKTKLQYALDIKSKSEKLISRCIDDKKEFYNIQNDAINIIINCLKLMINYDA